MRPLSSFDWQAFPGFVPPVLLRSLFIAIAIFLSITASRSEQVVISEIMYHPAPGKPEYLELWNITNTPMDTALWRFSSGINFTFPNFNPGAPSAHLLLPFERILVSSASPAATRAAYPNIPTNVRIFGPWGGGSALANEGETITLEDKNGVVVCRVSYQDSGKWPVAADGPGYSLVLADENQAIDDWRVWRASRNRFGSPGVADPAPVTGLALNEVHFHPTTGRVDWVEIINQSPGTTLNAAGHFLSAKDDFTDKVALSGNVTPGAVASFNLDFAPSNSGQITLYLIDASSNVLDAVKLQRAAGRPSHQVYPPGSRTWYSDTTDTRNLANHPARNTSIVINEIMADPPSNQRDGEFIELYNKSGAAVDVSGWRLDDDVNFTIPDGTSIPPGGYLVIGANAGWLNAHYSGLAAIGNWSGALSNQGNRVQLKDANGNLADEVDFRFGGEWPELASGDGSSLELINPEADNAVGSSWRDSDESAKSTFAPYTIHGGTYRKKTYEISDDEIQLWLVGDSHVVLRNIELRPTAGGANLLANAGVTTSGPGNVDGWRSQGNHWATHHDAEGVHFVAEGGGDQKANHAEKDAAGLIAGTEYTLTFEARWIYGKPRIVAQTWDLSWGGTVQLPIPANLGTPGAQNSRYVPAAPSAVTGLSHSPAVPKTGNTVTVSAKVTAPSPIQSVQLFHRLDNASYNGVWTSSPMIDNGTGLYTASVPLASFPGYNSNGAIVEYYVRATASNGQTTDLPRGSTSGEPFAAAQRKTGLWVVDNAPVSTDLRRLRIVISNHYLAALDTPGGTANGTVMPLTGGGSAAYQYKFPRLSSHYFPCVVIHNDSTVVYGAGVHKSGSPVSRETDNKLERGRVILPGDRPFRGHRRISWDNDHATTKLFHNRIHRYLLYLCGVPANENEVLRITRNHTAYAIRESYETFDKDLLGRLWEKGSHGSFYELDRAYFIGDDGSTRLEHANIGWDYDPPDRAGPENPVSYHGNFVIQSREAEYDFGGLIEWLKQIELNTLSDEQLARMADLPAMAAYAAVRGYTADWDNFTMREGKNGYFYQKPTDHRWMLLQWDSDNAFDTTHIADDFIGNQTNVRNFYHRPLVRRYLHYYMAQLLGPFALNGPRLAAYLAAEEGASTSFTVPNTYASWPTASNGSLTRPAVMQAFIGNATLNAPFALASPVTTTTEADVSFNGTAPPGVFRVACAGHPEAGFAWTGTSTTDTQLWSLNNVRLRSGANALVFRAYDAEGTQIGADLVHTVTKTGNSPPLVQVITTPPSRNVSLGEPLLFDASASVDPEGGALAFQFTVSPPTGFTITAPSAASRSLIFTTPGVYTITVQATDPASATASASQDFTVFSAADFSSFGEDTLPAVFTPLRLELRDNYAAGSWYSLRETDGSIVLSVSGTIARPLSLTAPQFPLLLRELPDWSNWTLQTRFTTENRQYGNFLAGLFVETSENGLPAYYAFGCEGGLEWKVYRATAISGAFTAVANAPFIPPDATLRVRRVENTLRFEIRPDGVTWAPIYIATLPANSTAEAGGIFLSTGGVNGDATPPGTSLRVAFDYLLLSDPGQVADLVSNLRITELMYHPAADGVEFIELRNIGSVPLNLAGAYFPDDTPFSSPFVFGATMLQPGQFCVVTNDSAGFGARYGPGVLIAGEASGNLDNGGERIVLNDAAGNPIHDFAYGSVEPWPTEAAGGGASLEAIDLTPSLYPHPANWRASQENGGSPGYIGLAQDSDADGIPDSVEIAFGSDPNSAASFPLRPLASRNPANGDATIAWQAANGRTYVVEYRDDFLLDTWHDLTTVTAESDTVTFTDHTAAGQPQRFYRVRTQFP